MGKQVDIVALADRLAEYRFAYLLTVGDNDRVHTSAVHPTVVGDVLVIPSASTRVQANALQRPAISLVWPPPRDDDYSLIVDGDAQAHGDELHISPTRAVLHRPAPRVTPADGSTCVSDCVEI